MKVTRIFFVILSILLMMSCGPGIQLKQYQAPQNGSSGITAPDQQKTELMYLDSYIIAVDGHYFTPQGQGMKKVRVSPGKHQIKVLFLGNVTKFGCNAVINVNLPEHEDPGAIALAYLEGEFEAGKEYILTYDVSIQDRGTMSRVGGFLKDLNTLVGGRQEEEEKAITHDINVTNVHLEAQ